MKAILHLMAKDLRRYWPFAALIVGVSALFLLRDYFGMEISRQNRSFQEALSRLFLWPMVFLFVVAVVQEDTPAGGKSFWFTRPIWPGELLAAKLLLIFAVLIVPYAIGQALFALAIDSGASLAVCIALEATGGMVLITLAAALVAALTSTILQAAALVALGLLGFMLVIGIFNDNFSTWLAFLPGRPARLPSDASRLVAAWSVGIVATFLVLQLHYRRRRVGLTAAGIGGALLMVLFTSSHWRFELIPEPQPLPPPVLPASTVPAGFVITALDQTADVAGLWRGPAKAPAQGKTLYQRVVLPVNITHPTHHRLITLTAATSRLAFADGSVREFPETPSYQPDQRAVSQWLQNHLGFPNVSATSWTFRPVVAAISEDEAKRTLAPGTTLHAALKATESILEREATLALANRTTHRLPDGVLFLDRVSQGYTSREKPSVRIEFRMLNALSIFAPQANSRPDIDPTVWAPLQGRFFVLYRRATNEFSVGAVGSHNFSTPAAAQTQRGSVQFFNRLGPGMDKPALGLTPEWIADAELWILHRVPVSEFTYPLVVENFRIVHRADGSDREWVSAPELR